MMEAHNRLRRYDDNIHLFISLFLHNVGPGWAHIHSAYGLLAFPLLCLFSVFDMECLVWKDIQTCSNPYAI